MHSAMYKNTTVTTLTQALELSDAELQQVAGGVSSTPAPHRPNHPAHPKRPAHPSLPAHNVLDRLHALMH
ncbi:MAG: hypothetical protein H0U76_26800 [Ktedonobacteraceae bacterium]|nr:hypothetical protein [Ktedonobacteraceae bacterium]